MFDDPSRHNDLLQRLRSAGTWAPEVMQAVKKGAHEGYRGNLHALIDDSKRLASWLSR